MVCETNFSCDGIVAWFLYRDFVAAISNGSEYIFFPKGISGFLLGEIMVVWSHLLHESFGVIDVSQLEHPIPEGVSFY